MDIRYLGHSSFHIKTKTASIVTDPYNPEMVGLKFPKTEADIVTVSHHHPDHDFVQAVSGTPIVFDWPGEFEKLSVRIFGFSSFHDGKKGEERGENIMYKFEAEDISLLHCGDLGHSLTDAMVEDIGAIDIVCIPVGGTYTINASQAVDIVKKLEPSIIIPMHYNHPKLNQDKFGTLSPLSEFMEKMGNPEVVPTQKLTVKKEDLIDEMKVTTFEI